MKVDKSKIKRELIDMAGKHRVWVEMENREWQMLKFDKDPTLAEIQSEIDKIIKLKEEENAITNS